MPRYQARASTGARFGQFTRHLNQVTQSRSEVLGHHGNIDVAEAAAAG
ncbi:hypothetical protein [Chelatococcus reniformis]|nr:hypothetical protein [Chelatococcus reniformis]